MSVLNILFQIVYFFAKVDRNPVSGELLGFYEEDIDSGVSLTAKNSCSLNRAPGPPSEALRGTTTNFPFWPGEFKTINYLKTDVILMCK